MAPFRSIIVMGVSGSGKTTFGEQLAVALGWQFADADSFHPPANVEKMRAGHPLDDNDRAPWLATLNGFLRDAVARDQPMVLACSALKARYRDLLREGTTGVALIYLHGSFETISERLAGRHHAYMPPTLLKSQFDALEEPGDAVVLDIREPVDQLVAQVLTMERESRGA